MRVWAGVEIMKLDDKKLRNRKNKASKAREHEQGPVLDPLEVKQYEKGRLKKGDRFGKKWFPENKGD